MLQVRSQLQELVGRITADRRGVTAVITALALTILVGFCGLAVDVVMWEVNQRQLQGAADQAALAAATAFRNAGETGALGDSTTAQNAAYATAIASGYPAASVSVAAYNGGASCTGDGCLQVTIAQQQPQYFTALFLSAFTASASAVGTCSGCGSGSFNVTSTGGGACVMALDASGSGVITASGTPTLSLNGCNLQNNSPNTSATIMHGGATVEGCSTTNACGSMAFLAQPDTPSGSIDVPIVTNAAPAPDPYAGLTPPTFGTCTPWPSGSTATIGGGSGTVTTYCNPGSLSIQTITIATGSTIVITGGFSAKGNFAISGTGTLYVTGGASLNANATIGISAPTTGPYAGIAVWFGGNSAVQWAGGNSSSFSGTIYAPTAAVTMTGGAGIPTSCARMIAGSLSLSGNATATFDNTGCPAVAGPVLTASGASGSTTNTGQPMLVQ
jgi:Flp pilus assembly protein TadG